MNKPNKVHILFERSGTFKKAFKSFGISAIDYDLEAEHEEVVKTNLFSEIIKEYYDNSSLIFAEIKDNDLVIAFFPCTYFSDQSQLASRGDAFQMKNFSEEEKLKRSITDMTARADFYNTLCRLCIIAKRKNFKLIIENPYGKVNFLKHFFPIKPDLVIRDRRTLGDFYKKPTQFFFVNCHPEFVLEQEYIPTKKNKAIEDIHGFERSRISEVFAKKFIEQFLKNENW